MPNTAKYTLWFTDGEGWIKVTNRVNVPQSLYLGYMTTGPAPSLYPRTEVTLQTLITSEVSSGSEQPVVLDMNSADEFGGRAVHISRLQRVGVIQPGDTVVRFRELEEAARPFRLVSIMITSTDEDGPRLTHLPGGNEK